MSEGGILALGVSPLIDRVIRGLTRLTPPARQLAE
jgi:hypothetical protein